MMMKACSAEGILEKRSIWLKKWNSRYGRIRGRTLCYYDDETSQLPRGEISLIDAEVSPASLIKEGRRFGIEILEINKGSTTVHQFALENEQQQDYWLKAMQAVTKTRPARRGHSEKTNADNTSTSDNSKVNATPNLTENSIEQESGDDSEEATTVAEPIAVSVPLPPPDATDPLSYLMNISSIQTEEELAPVAQKPNKVKKKKATVTTSKPAITPSASPSLGLKQCNPKATTSSEISGEVFRDAVTQNQVERVVEILKAKPEFANYKDGHDNTMLHLACMFKHEDVCIALISAGAKINAKNGQNEEPLSLAPPRLQAKLTALARTRDNAEQTDI